jgi:hypothetical protein
MWETAGLPLDPINIRFHRPEDAPIFQIVDNALQLQHKNTGHDVGMVLPLLASRHRAGNFIPMRIASYRNEQVRLSEAAGQGQSIKVQLLVVPGAAHKT